MLKLRLADSLNRFWDGTHVSIIVALIIAGLILVIILLGVHSLRELQRVNNFFATFLLCEKHLELPKTVALEILNGAFHSKIANCLVVDIYKHPVEDDWVRIIVQKDEEKTIKKSGFIATATEKNFGMIILKHLL